ncbi:hypothetical protein F5Y15DRAFT_34570 [Xylariaceae sp. FL0016]|nr:hypothetical protein F5Y15DRAFT_34570 [Xylariaceae sp. FL0016]
MSAKTFAALALMGASSVDAFWRMECRGRTGLARIDPIMDSGTVSSHVHTVHGSSGFSIVADFDSLTAGNCTSCAVTADKSAYWTPALYFHDTDADTFNLVPQVGGMLAYYLQRGDDVKAFPQGFQMIAGSNYRRNYTVGDVYSPDPPQSNWAALKQTGQDDLEQRALGFNCLNYQKDAEASLYRHYMPDKDYLDANCPDGLRLELMFPSCWNGEDDSSDHKSHVAYPDLVGNGNCPDTHTQRLVTLFYETIWDTGDSAFSGKNGEFVVSNGDPTGFGYHGDFMSGWEESFLQNAIDTCTNESGELSDCSVFTDNAPLLSESEMGECTFDMPSALATEDCSATDMTSLPGNLPIQSGPEEATKVGTDPIASVTSAIGSFFTGSATTTASPYKQSGTKSYSPEVSSTGAGGVYIQSPDVAVASVTSSTSTPLTTPAPVVTSEAGVVYEVVSTQTVTTGAEVEEIVWKEPVLYVTEDTTTTVTMAQKMKLRRDHAWRHRHHERR